MSKVRNNHNQQRNNESSIRVGSNFLRRPSLFGRRRQTSQVIVSIDQAKLQRVTTNIANKSNLPYYIIHNPTVAHKLYNNSNAIEKLDANPKLLDDMENDPETKLNTFLAENPSPNEMKKETTARCCIL